MLWMSSWSVAKMHTTEENKEEEGLRECEMAAEERHILEHFERDELVSAENAECEIEQACLVARNTFNKTRRVNLRVTVRDFKLAHFRAPVEGIPYQTLLSSVIHKYLNGRLLEKP